MMARKSQMLRAELAVAELEDALVDAKANGMPADELAKLKADVREARRTFREMRAGSAPEATVSPDLVAATARAGAADAH